MLHVKSTIGNYPKKGLIQNSHWYKRQATLVYLELKRDLFDIYNIIIPYKIPHDFSNSYDTGILEHKIALTMTVGPTFKCCYLILTMIPLDANRYLSSNNRVNCLQVKIQTKVWNAQPDKKFKKF